jgi:hypothetical protein
MYKDKGETYNPSENGFVFSEPQIAATQLDRTRDCHYDEALE